MVIHASPIATKTLKNIRGIADFKHLQYLIACLCISFAALSYKITKRSLISDQVRYHWETTICLIFDHEEPVQRARASENQDTFNISNISFCIQHWSQDLDLLYSTKHSWSLSCSKRFSLTKLPAKYRDLEPEAQKKLSWCLPHTLGKSAWEAKLLAFIRDAPPVQLCDFCRTLSGMFAECWFMTSSQNYQQYLYTNQVYCIIYV